jgi:hypothetical protein
MGRFKLDEKDKLIPFWGSVKPNVIEKLGRQNCKKIAEEAVNREYKKQMKQ